MRAWQTGLAAVVFSVSAASAGSAQTVLSEAELDQVTAGIELPADLIPSGVPSITNNIGTAFFGAGTQLRNAGLQQRQQGNTSTGNALLGVGLTFRALGIGFQ